MGSSAGQAASHLSQGRFNTKMGQKYERGDAVFANATSPSAYLNPAGSNQAGNFARRSKNNAWLIMAFTVSGLNGLVIRNVGSGRSPVSNRSG